MSAVRGEPVDLHDTDGFTPSEVWTEWRQWPCGGFFSSASYLIYRYDFIEPILKRLTTPDLEAKSNLEALLRSPKLEYERLVELVRTHYPAEYTRYEGIIRATLEASRALQLLVADYKQHASIDQTQVVDYARRCWSLGATRDGRQDLVTVFFVNCFLDHEELVHREDIWLTYMKFQYVACSKPCNSEIARRCCPGNLQLRIHAFTSSLDGKQDWAAILSEADEIMADYEPEDVENVEMQLQMFHAFRCYNPNYHCPVERAKFVNELLHNYMYGLRDPKQRIKRLWMQIEYCLGQLDTARKIMKELGQNSHLKLDADFWLKVARCEGNSGNAEFQTILTEALDGPMAAGETQFLKKVLDGIKMVINESGSWRDRHHVQVVEGELFAKGLIDEPMVRNIEASRKRGPPADLSRRDKQERLDIDETPDPQATVFLNNLSFKASEVELEGFLEGELGLGCRRVILGRDKQGNSRGFAHAVLLSADMVRTAVEHDRILFLGRPLFISPYQPVPKAQRQHIDYPKSRDPKTLYVSQLPLDTTKADLQTVFEGYAGLVAIRLIISKSGHFKCAAYVQFEDKDKAAAALECDGRQVRGQMIRVQISDPDAARAKAAVLAMRPRNVKPKPKLDTAPAQSMQMD